MRKFECKVCDKIFQAKGEKREWHSQVYGNCSEWLAKCSCGTEAKEYCPPKTSKRKKRIVCAQGGNCECCPMKSLHK